MNREEIIQSIIKKVDIRSQKWEYRIILDVLQEFDEGASIKDIQAEILNEHGCELLSYDSIYYNLKGLVGSGIIDNGVDKIFKIKPEYVIVDKVSYLPLSAYCVYLFGTLILGLVLAIWLEYEVQSFIIAVMVAALFIFAQIKGSEFKFRRKLI